MEFGKFTGTVQLANNDASLDYNKFMLFLLNFNDDMDLTIKDIFTNAKGLVYRMQTTRPTITMKQFTNIEINLYDVDKFTVAELSLSGTILDFDRYYSKLSEMKQKYWQTN